MSQAELFHEDIYSAYRTDVQAAGGFKVVGHKMRSTMKVDKAGEWLSQALTENRPEKLTLDDQIFIKKEARKVGSYAALTFEMQELSMTMPQPIEPEDERARLKREVVQAAEDFKKLIARLEKVS